jgi:hypothetical protein
MANGSAKVSSHADYGIRARRANFRERLAPGRRWHRGQKNVDRWACTIRSIAAPQAGHGSPARPYTRCRR